MPYVVTQSCCSDASCVYACPVNCIHPTPDEPDFLTAEMLHIDPAACVDCGACVSACPVDAIVPHSKLTDPQQRFLSLNAEFYKQPRDRPALAPVSPAPSVRQDRGPLRVAIVGSGPAAMYAADELLTQPGVQVNVFDRLATPYGLVRAGVAPDHQQTKQVTALFDTIADQDGFEFFLNVEVGRHVTHDDLLAHHHAVVYAVGACSDRRLGIAGEDLPGASSATDFVAWYNGHPDHAGDGFDLSQRRAVIIGNGNVALDVARILTADPDYLATTDICGQALRALRASRIEEVVIVGRRGIGQSAFTVPEFASLLARPDLDIRLDPSDAPSPDPVGGFAVEQKARLLGQLDGRHASQGRRIVLRYLASPVRITGDDRVTGVDFVRNSLVTAADGSVRTEPTGETFHLDAGLVLTSIGYRGVAVDALPFDEFTGVVPNAGGRVLDAPDAYVAGWIKRGPTGFIGTNKSCAQQTVMALVDDFNAGRLSDPAARPSALARLVRSRRPELVDRAGWRAIDELERRRGAEQNRVRDKITDPVELAAVGASRRGRLPILDRAAH